MEVPAHRLMHIHPPIVMSTLCHAHLLHEVDHRRKRGSGGGDWKGLTSGEEAIMGHEPPNSICTYASAEGNLHKHSNSEHYSFFLTENTASAAFIGCLIIPTECVFYGCVYLKIICCLSVDFQKIKALRMKGYSSSKSISGEGRGPSQNSPDIPVVQEQISFKGQPSGWRKGGKYCLPEGE